MTVTKNEYEPDLVFRPREAITEQAVALGISLDELPGMLGVSASDLEEIMAGTHPIGPSYGAALEGALGAPASYWMAISTGWSER